MKPNVKMIDKSKNSFIYFQLGLIATMVAVLFVLEFNFETKVPKVTAFNKIEMPDEVVFTYNPKTEAPKSEPRKTIARVVVQPKIVNRYEISKEEVNDDVVKQSVHQETPTETKTTDVSADRSRSVAHRKRTKLG